MTRAARAGALRGRALIARALVALKHEGCRVMLRIA